MAIIYTPGNAKASQVLEGVGFSAGAIYNGVGTMVSKAGQYLPATLDESSFGEIAVVVNSSDAGYHNGSTRYVVEEPNLQPYNIPQGMIMFGIQGSMVVSSPSTFKELSAFKLSISPVAVPADLAYDIVDFSTDIRQLIIHLHPNTAAQNRIIRSDPSSTLTYTASIGLYNVRTGFYASLGSAWQNDSANATQALPNVYSVTRDTGRGSLVSRQSSITSNISTANFLVNDPIKLQYRVVPRAGYTPTSDMTNDLLLNGLITLVR